MWVNSQSLNVETRDPHIHALFNLSKVYIVCVASAYSHNLSQFFVIGSIRSN